MTASSDKKHDIEAVLGTVSLGMEESTEQTLQVEEAIIHENYRETPSAVENDIGDPITLFFQIKLPVYISITFRAFSMRFYP